MTAIADNKLAEITREIHEREEQARQSAGFALQHKIAIGGRLGEARKLLNRDDYRRWARDEFGWDERHIRRHLQLWRARTRVSALPAGASLRMALAALKEPKALRVLPEQGDHVVYIVTGHVTWPTDVTFCMGAPDVSVLVGACTDWKVRRG